MVLQSGTGGILNQFHVGDSKPVSRSGTSRDRSGRTDDPPIDFNYYGRLSSEIDLNHESVCGPLTHMALNFGQPAPVTPINAQIDAWRLYLPRRRQALVVRPPAPGLVMDSRRADSIVDVVWIEPRSIPSSVMV